MHAASPQTFLEMLGGLLFAVGVLFALLSLLPSLRGVALRLSAMLLLSATSLFANHWATYFASIFIIATAVTEVEFLHILAAIVRGDKNYFVFRREFLTQAEVLEKARDDADAGRDRLPPRAEDAVDPLAVQPLRLPAFDASSNARLAFQLEERALAWFERKFGVTVQKYVRFASGQRIVELDGVVQGGRGEPDTIVEVKWARDPSRTMIRHVLEHTIDIPHRYKEITKRDATLSLLLIVPTTNAVPASVVEQIRARATSAGTNISVVLVSYDELGVIVERTAETVS